MATRNLASLRYNWGIDAVKQRKPAPFDACTILIGLIIVPALGALFLAIALFIIGIVKNFQSMIYLIAIATALACLILALRWGINKIPDRESYLGTSVGE